MTDAERRFEEYKRELRSKNMPDLVVFLKCPVHGMAEHRIAFPELGRDQSVPCIQCVEDWGKYHAEGNTGKFTCHGYVLRPEKALMNHPPRDLKPAPKNPKPLTEDEWRQVEDLGIRRRSGGTFSDDEHDLLLRAFHTDNPRYLETFCQDHSLER